MRLDRSKMYKVKCKSTSTKLSLKYSGTPAHVIKPLLGCSDGTRYNRQALHHYTTL